MGQELRSTDYVCEKHITSDMMSGELGGVVRVDESVLHPEAIPCLFPEVSSHLSLANTKREPQETAADTRDNSAKKAKLDCSVDDLLRSGGSGDEFRGEVDSDSSPQTCTEFGEKTRESLQPVLQSGVVKSEHFGGPSEDFARPVESDFLTQSPVHSNVVKSEPLTEPSCEECKPALRADANLCLESSLFSNVVKSEPFTEVNSVADVPAILATFASPLEPSVQSPVCGNDVKSEPSTESGSEERVSVTPAEPAFSVESSCQSPVHSNAVKSEPFTEPISEECVPATLVVSTAPLESSGLSPVHSSVVKSEPSTESGNEDCVPAPPTETDIPLESSGQGTVSSSAITNGHPAGVKEEPACQKSLPPQDKEQTCSCRPARRISEQRRVVLPSPAWKHQEISVDGVKSLCFFELRKASPTSPVFVFKCLELAATKGGLKVTKCVLGHVVDSVVVPVFRSTNFVLYISTLLSSLDKQAVCRGGPARNECPDVRLGCASVDAIGFWRHDRCTLCLDGTGTRCVHCRSLSDMVRLYVECKKREEEEEHAMLLLCLSERTEQ